MIETLRAWWDRQSVARAVGLFTILVTVTLALTGPAVTPSTAQESATGPEIAVQDVTVSGGNVSLTLTATNATEIDLTNIPADWTVRTHRDDSGTFLNEIEENGRLVWLWPAPVQSSVSVTFAVPDGTEQEDLGLRALTYVGTTEGEMVTIGMDSQTENETTTTSGSGPVITPVGGLSVLIILYLLTIRSVFDSKAE